MQTEGLYMLLNNSLTPIESIFPSDSYLQPNSVNNGSPNRNGKVDRNMIIRQSIGKDSIVSATNESLILSSDPTSPKALIEDSVQFS